MIGRTLWIALLVQMPIVAHAHDDRVSFTPGSQLVGELKRMERGRLYFKTDATDQISIDWQDVETLVSKQQLQVEMTSGMRYFGHLLPAVPGNIAIAARVGTRNLVMADIVRITPIEEQFRDRWDIDLSAGYNFTKASDIEQLTLGLSTTYTTEKRRNSFYGQVNQTGDSQGESVIRWSARANTIRLRQNRWFNGYLGNVERNDGQGLELRTSLGVGAGRYLLQTNNMNLGALAGIMGSREQTIGREDTEHTVEALLAAEFDLFRYAEPEIDLHTRLSVFPNISDPGRVRTDYDLRLRWELVDDFYWEMAFNHTYDSNPVSEDGDGTDWSITTGVAWDL